MVEIHFGALCDPIIKQLNKQGYCLSEKDDRYIQDLADAVILLKLHKIIPESIAHKAQQKIMKEILEMESLTEEDP